MLPDLRSAIRTVPDFPKKGIMFRDITTLIKDPDLLHRVVDVLADHYSGKNVQAVAAIESRGFILGAPLAYKLGVGFIPIRKPGKLPAAVTREEYSLPLLIASSLIWFESDVLRISRLIGSSRMRISKIAVRPR